MDFSRSSILDYCFDYDAAKEKAGACYRNTNPKRLVDGISLQDLFKGNEVMFKVGESYEEKVMEEENPDVFNEVFFSEAEAMKERRGAPPPNCSFTQLAKEMTNVTDDGCVKKQIISQGVGDVIPANSYVTVEYNMYKENCDIPFDSTYLRGRREKFRLDEGETILGLTYAIRSMRKRENSRFFIHWSYAFGSLGCPDRIEPKCSIVADVTVVDYVEFEAEALDPNGLTEDEIFKKNLKVNLNMAKRHHTDGNDDFRRGDTAGAIRWDGIKLLNELRFADVDEEKAVQEQKVKTLQNLALCYNKLGKYEQACLACQEILAIDYKNVKACFHYGKASAGLSDFQNAKKWLMRAAKLKPNDSDISNELRKLDEMKMVQKSVDKMFWEKAFQSVYISKDGEKDKEEPQNKATMTSEVNETKKS